jgi:hypothetical protein
MLIERERQAGIRSGEVTLLFRRWRTRRATAGTVYRTAAGRVAVDAIDVVHPGEITADDAARAGYDSPAALVADLRGAAGDPVYRLVVRHVAEPDPRDVLAGTAHLTGEERGALDARLARLDRSGPWTGATLRLIARRPGVRAADLAADLGTETPTFKTNVRKLKNLGLTLSLETGYTLSPRGRAYLGLPVTGGRDHAAGTAADT